jgi:soluble lytic murein transglycosylase-like protein
MIWFIPLCITNLLIFAPEMAIPRHVEMQIAEYAFGLPRGILGAVAHVESRGNPKAISRTGDYGLLQVNCATWKRKLPIRSCRELLDPHRSIWSGAWILSRCHRRWGHLPDQTWIGAYNAGTPHGPRAIAYRDRVIEAWATILARNRMRRS